MRLVAIGAVVACSLYAAYYLVGPSLDNRLHIYTDRDLGRFRALPLDDSQSLGAAIESRAGRCEWVAAHDEYIFATNIECMSGGPTRLVWELNHAAPRPWLERRVLYVTPVTRSAAELVPELLPSGVRLEQIPLTKFSSGVIYDLAR